MHLQHRPIENFASPAGRSPPTMTRHAKLMWMKDLLEHMTRCHEQWETADPRAERFLLDSMRRDVEEFRRVCESMRAEAVAGPTLARGTVAAA
jgi:hypothetical protein